MGKTILVSRWGLLYVHPYPSNRTILLTDYDSILETYTLSELIELSDLSEADVLEVLVEAGVVNLPEILPLEFHEASM